MTVMGLRSSQRFFMGPVSEAHQTFEECDLRTPGCASHAPISRGASSCTPRRGPAASTVWSRSRDSSRSRKLVLREVDIGLIL